MDYSIDRKKKRVFVPRAACRRRDLVTKLVAVLGTVVACAISFWMIGAYGTEGNAFVVGTCLFGAAPLVGCLYFVRATKRPVVINFDDDVIELRVRNVEYLDRLVEWCCENDVLVEEAV